MMTRYLTCLAVLSMVCVTPLRFAEAGVFVCNDSGVEATLLSVPLLLTSCLESDKPLLGGGYTPLPKSFRAVAIDSYNNVTLTAAGTADILEFNQAGLSYRTSNTANDTTITLSDFDTAAGIYTIQVSVSKSNAAPERYLFGLMMKDRNIISLYFTTPKLEAAIYSELKGKDISPSFPMSISNGSLSIHTQNQLTAVLEIFANHLSEAGIQRYRVGTSPSERASIDNDVAFAQSHKNASVSSNPLSTSVPEPFPTNDYWQPLVMQTIYDGTLSGAIAGKQPDYWASFVRAIEEYPDCGSVVPSFTKNYLAIMEGLGVTQGMINTIIEAHQADNHGNLSESARIGLSHGLGFDARLIERILHAQNDAEIFHTRHGCKSTIAKRFLDNMASVINRM